MKLIYSDRMNLIATGIKSRFEELQQSVSGAHSWTWSDNLSETNLELFDAIFDLGFDDTNQDLAPYAELKGKPVFVSAVKSGLALPKSKLSAEMQCTLAGINCQAGFINRGLKEVSALNEIDKPAIEKCAEQLGWKLQWVDDRIGMVTPRIVYMIINEAFYTLQEGTASAADIDLGMKLGTNYPMGPFEWLKKVGVKDVYETLDALYNDTREERYKICPLLKKEYLKG